jgi:uncharacterized membrane protein required for colicin V production
MVSLNILFTIFVVLFGMIGAVRGLRKELVVIVSGILALFIIQEVLPRLLGDLSGTKALSLNLIVLFVCGFLGYQTPALRRFAESGRFNRDTLMEIILGAVFGALNGYWLVGSAWYFIDKAGYPFSWIIAPDAATEAGQQAIELLQNMVPQLLTGNGLYVAIAIAVLIIIGVMI